MFSARVTQLVECLPSKQNAAGSIPVTCSILLYCDNCKTKVKTIRKMDGRICSRCRKVLTYMGVAQLVEWQTPNLQVVGSKPTSHAKYCGGRGETGDAQDCGSCHSEFESHLPHHQRSAA